MCRPTVSLVMARILSMWGIDGDDQFVLITPLQQHPGQVHDRRAEGVVPGYLVVHEESLAAGVP